MPENKLPPMVATHSSNIAEVGHDGAHLYVRFHGKDGGFGPLWRYNDCPGTHHEAMMQAKSVGGYFHSNIRKGFKGEKIG